MTERDETVWHAREAMGDGMREALSHDRDMGPREMARVAYEGLLSAIGTYGFDARDVVDVVDPTCVPATRPGLGMPMPSWDPFGECDWPRDVCPHCHTDVSDPDGGLLPHCPGCGARVVGTPHP